MILELYMYNINVIYAYILIMSYEYIEIAMEILSLFTLYFNVYNIDSNNYMNSIIILM